MQSLTDAIKKRVDMINDPKEIVEDLELENFNLNNLESAF